MEKVAMYKAFIEKRAMALSKREFEGARQAISNGVASENKIKNIVEPMGRRLAKFKDFGFTRNEKPIGSKDALGLMHKVKDSVPGGKEMIVKNILDKKTQFSPEDIKNGEKFVGDKLDTLKSRGFKNIDKYDYHNVRQQGYVSADNPSYQRYSNILATNPSNIAITSHEMGHAATVHGKTGKENIDNFLNDKDVRKGHGPKDLEEFHDYVNKAYGDGNRNSKEIGHKLKNVYQEARDHEDAKLLEELRANAKSYHYVHDNVGKDVADKTLSTNLSSIGSYVSSAARDKNRPHAKEFMDHFFKTPISSGGRKVNGAAYLTGERDARYVKDQRNIINAKTK